MVCSVFWYSKSSLRKHKHKLALKTWLSNILRRHKWGCEVGAAVNLPLTLVCKQDVRIMLLGKFCLLSDSQRWWKWKYLFYWPDNNKSVWGGRACFTFAAVLLLFQKNQITNCAPLIHHLLLMFLSNSHATLLLLFQTNRTICGNTNSLLTALNTDTHLRGHQPHWTTCPPFFNIYVFEQKDADTLAAHPNGQVQLLLFFIS